MRLSHDSPDGMCIYGGCQCQAEKLVSWVTSQGTVQAPLCRDHMRECWNKTVATSRETFTIRPLGGVT